MAWDAKNQNKLGHLHERLREAHLQAQFASPLSKPFLRFILISFLMWGAVVACVHTALLLRYHFKISKSSHP